VGTTAVPLPTGTFAAGGDYTILVYGALSPTGTPTATILTDDNQIDANYASIRLINGAVPDSTVAGAVKGVILVVNGIAAPGPVLYGTDGSPYNYSGFTPSSSATIEIAGGGAAYTGSPLTGVQLTSGSVYTLVVYDAASPLFSITDR
jgi:hypothetical protein